MSGYLSEPEWCDVSTLGGKAKDPGFEILAQDKISLVPCFPGIMMMFVGISIYMKIFFSGKYQQMSFFKELIRENQGTAHKRELNERRMNKIEQVCLGQYHY